MLMDRQPLLPDMSCSSESVFKADPDKSTKDERVVGARDNGLANCRNKLYGLGTGHHKPSACCAAQVGWQQHALVGSFT